MKCCIEKGELVIRIPLLKTPRPSSSGKNLTIASSGGCVKTDAMMGDKPITVGLNAFIKPD